MELKRLARTPGCRCYAFVPVIEVSVPTTLEGQICSLVAHSSTCWRSSRGMHVQWIGVDSISPRGILVQ